MAAVASLCRLVLFEALFKGLLAERVRSGSDSNAIQVLDSR